MRIPITRTVGVAGPWRAVFALVLTLLLAVAARAETIIVGPTRPALSLREALERARDGDTIALLSGEYRNVSAVISHRKLTLRGVGKRPVLVTEGVVPDRAATLVVRNGDVEIDNLEFRGARAQDANGAAIRFDAGRLTVRRSAFFDNENAILTSHAEAAEVLIEDSEFGQVPRVEGGLHHLLNIGRIAKVTVRGSRFHSGYEGHLIKSRARQSVITYNLIYDGPDGEASYEIDLPMGGMAWIIGNIIGQGPDGQNFVMLAYGSEGNAWDKSGLYVSHNTFVGNPWPPSWYVRVFRDRLPKDVEVRAVNNLSVGLGLLSPGTEGYFAGNQWALRRRALQSVWSLEFGLARDSELRGTGVDPGNGGGLSLAPTAEFTLPVGTRPLKPPPVWSPGAIQP